MRQSRVNHSKIVEQLEKEKQKIQQDVERLEQMRLRRNSTVKHSASDANQTASRVRSQGQQGQDRSVQNCPACQRGQ